MKAVYFEGEKGETVRRDEIPENLKEAAETARSEMLEQLSLFSDDLMEQLLEESEIDEKEIHKIVREATLAREITPVMMGTAFKDKGVQELLDAVTRYLPSPLDREMYANSTDEEDEDGNPKKVLLKSDKNAPLVSMAFKTVVETFGQLTYFRIYQGQIKKGEMYTNMRTGKPVRFGRLVRMHADSKEEIESAEAGDIIALVGVDCASGDTFCGDGIEVSLENIYVADPVIRLSVEPAKRDDSDKLGKALDRFRREDPTFQVSTDEETGQTIIAGMGPAAPGRLHRTH